MPTNPPYADEGDECNGRLTETRVAGLGESDDRDNGYNGNESADDNLRVQRECFTRFVIIEQIHAKEAIGQQPPEQILR